MKGNFRSELKTVLKVAKWEFLFKTFTSVMIRGILLIIPILFSAAINYITAKDTYMTIVMLVISIILVGIYRFFEGFNYVAYYKLFNKLFSFYNDEAISLTKDNSMFSLSRFSPGQYTNMVITDVDIISTFFASGVIRVIQMIEFGVIFIYFYFIDIYIFAFSLIVTIIMLMISLRLGNKVQKLNEKRKYQLDRVTSSAYDYFGGIKEIKSFNIFDKIYPKIEDSREDYLKANAKYNTRFNCNNHAILFVFELFRLLAVIYMGLRAIEGHADVGIVLVIYNYYQKIIDNCSIVLTLNVEYRNVNVSLQRFNKIREYSSHPNGTKVLEKDTVKGEIEFNDVLYGFRDNPILNHISFKIPENSITVFSGSNETVQVGIFDLLQRLNRQHEGTITLDGIEIKDINDTNYFSLVSSVRRQTMFFDIPIKENFTMINPDFDKVVEICKMVGLDEEIMKLDKGYDTIVDENTQLTMSCKKLLVIVRMLLKESKVLLIDDVINVLEEKHEKRLMDVLMELKKDHTIIVVTHSKRIIDRADLVLDITSNSVNEVGK
ncbi:MAG: ABC transporter ATP-binding protein [Bacilli bacterium]|nr:ABC transporter ATP-binding protein [Bacilli bacterium]